MKFTIKAKIMAIQDGTYSNYVFQNLELPETNEYRYITITKCPNWNCPEQLKVGDVGFVTYEFANAGDTYLEASTNEHKQYKYNAYYFMNFIKQKEDIKIDNYKF